MIAHNDGSVISLQKNNSNNVKHIMPNNVHFFRLFSFFCIYLGLYFLIKKKY